MDCSMPGLPVHHQLPEITQMLITSVMPSNHLILCCLLLLLLSIFPSIRVFSKESALHMRWPKYWSFSFSISPSNEYSGMLSFRMDWLDLLAVQGTLKSLLQHHLWGNRLKMLIVSTEGKLWKIQAEILPQELALHCSLAVGVTFTSVFSFAKWQ